MIYRYLRNLLGNTKGAFVLLAFACLTIVITLVQEVRRERGLEALRDLSSPRALIIRGGKQLRIAGSEVVHGDVILLAEADRVPTDARLLLVQDLQADESLLTGESLAVRKSLLGTGGNETALIQMAARGLRVRGIAKGMAMARALPQSQ
jgi:Ca2+-transporting ATPase